MFQKLMRVTCHLRTIFGELLFQLHVALKASLKIIILLYNNVNCCNMKPLISKIELDRATHCCDEPVLKPIGDHLEKTTQSSVFVSKSYFEASEIGLECSQYVSFDNSKYKYY